MGLLDKIYKKLGDTALNKERKRIDEIVANGHLVYLNNDKVKYTTTKDGSKIITMDEMAMIFVDSCGGVEKIVQVGLTPDDFKRVLIEKRGKK